MIKEVQGNDLYFAKVREGAIIPTKNKEDAGRDVYANFDEDYMIIYPNSTAMIPTGIASACNDDYYIQLEERGSTGTKGMSQRCGVIDSGYRNEWFVLITNTNNHIIIISKLNEEETNKAVFKNGGISNGTLFIHILKQYAKLVILPVPKMNTMEISVEELQAIPSKRGQGALGSSGK